MVSAVSSLRECNTRPAMESASLASTMSVSLHSCGCIPSIPSLFGGPSDSPSQGDEQTSARMRATAQSSQQASEATTSQPPNRPPHSRDTPTHIRTPRTRGDAHTQKGTRDIDRRVSSFLSLSAMTPLSVVASQWTSLKRRGLTCGGVVTALLTVLLSAYTFYIHAFNKCDMQSILLVRRRATRRVQRRWHGRLAPRRNHDVSAHSRGFCACLPPSSSHLLPTLSPNKPLLQVGARHLSTVNASYWLDYGTLLGAVRDGGLVPWEFDIDMAVMDEDCPKFLTLREAFAKDGLTMYARGEYISHKKRSDTRGHMGRGES